VRVVVTVGAGGEPKKEEGSGTPKGIEEKGGNPNCVPNGVTVALPPPLVKPAETDIQVFCSREPRFSPRNVVQTAVVI
jgi:hypothetical protein